MLYRAAFGWKWTGDSPEPLMADDIFDLASLTKVVATTTAAMQLVEQGRLDLDRPVATYWPDFAANGKAAITVRQLLTHTSGLPADLEAAGTWSGPEAGLARAAAIKAAHRPGERFGYSDVNFIALAALVQKLSGEPLDVYARRHVFEPLKMGDTGFLPPAAERSRIVPTDRLDGRLLWGEVQDPSARRMGGVAGHAGLFSTGDDLARFAQMLLNGGELDGDRILRPETVALMTRPEATPGGYWRGLGWDMASPYSRVFDAAFGPSSFGHTGYTGCSIWIDPDSGRFLIILTSRLNPDDHGDVKPLREKLAALVGPSGQASGVIQVSGPAR